MRFFDLKKSKHQRPYPTPTFNVCANQHQKQYFNHPIQLLTSFIPLLFSYITRIYLILTFKHTHQLKYYIIFRWFFISIQQTYIFNKIKQPTTEHILKKWEQQQA